MKISPKKLLVGGLTGLVVGTFAPIMFCTYTGCVVGDIVDQYVSPKESCADIFVASGGLIVGTLIEGSLLMSGTGIILILASGGAGLLIGGYLGSQIE